VRASIVSVVALAGALALPVAAQSESEEPAQSQPAKPTLPAGEAEAPKEAEHLKVQHILIGFRGKVPGKNLTRTQDEAEALAYELLKKAQEGADFDQLVMEHTDDRHPGIYGMANKGLAPAQGEFPRERMAPAFGDVSFALAVGEIGIADFNPRTSPYGWHIIKRVE
jgi:parvulin-like peptidyl-prolyl isomerase